MIRTFAPHLEILPAAQRQIWSELSAVTRLGLVLYGGTAIALRLGHRCSVDFDFFTDKPLDKQALTTALPFIDKSTVLQDQPEALCLSRGQFARMNFPLNFFAKHPRGNF